VNTHPLYDKDGRLFAFEIDNSIVGRRGVCRIVESIPGAILQRKPKLLSWLREAQFCEFSLDGEVYAVEEPYGDNSRYWVGPVDPRWLPQTEKVYDAFSDHGLSRLVVWFRIILFGGVFWVLWRIGEYQGWF